MSNIIVLPTSTSVDGPLVDRVLMLNTEKEPRFQCYGFIVTRNAPIQIVPKFAQEEPLRKALANGVLMDVTGQQEAAGGLGKMFSDIDKAVKSKTMSLVKEGEEIGPRVIVGTDDKGNSYLITPKDDADYERMQEEIRTTGRLRVEKPKQQSPATAAFGLSSIFTEEVAVLSPPGE